MKSWKLVCLMLVFVLMLAVFAGCSGGDSAEQESNTGETAPPTSQVWTRDRFTVAAQPKDLRYENGNLLVDATVASGIDTVDEDGNPNDGVKYFENIRFDVHVTMKKDVTDEEEKGEEMKVASATFSENPFILKKNSSVRQTFTFTPDSQLVKNLDLSKVSSVRIGLSQEIN